MSRRLLGFSLFSLVAVASVWVYIAARQNDLHAGRPLPTASNEPTPAAPPVVTLEHVRSAPHVYFSSTKTDEFGQVVVASLDAPNEERFVADLKCDRVDFAVERGVCLVDNRAQVLPPGLAYIVDRNMRTLATFDLPGFPSRTRISPDERYAATTVFLLGETYNGNFATRTYIIDLRSGTLVGDVERWATWRDGKKFSRVDFNFWGVTFMRDSNRFYATLGTGGKTYLVEGNVGERRFQVVRANVECPSLSPDERHMAFKQRVPGTLEWRLHVMELESMREWPIAAEDRSIDDQIEWLDDEHVLYHFAEERGLPEVAVNVWVSPIAPESKEGRRLFIRGGLSPAVVRPATMLTAHRAQ